MLEVGPHKDQNMIASSDRDDLRWLTKKPVVLKVNSASIGLGDGLAVHGRPGPAILAWP